MAYMVELDDKCRLELPNDLRESLHLSPGSHLKVERDGNSDRILLSPTRDEEEPRLEWRDGVPVIVGGPASRVDVVDQIRWMRAERSAHVMGPPYTAADVLNPEDEA